LDFLKEILLFYQISLDISISFTSKINKIPYYPHDGFNEWVIKLFFPNFHYSFHPSPNFKSLHTAISAKKSLKYGGFGAIFFRKILCMNHIELLLVLCKNSPPPPKKN
jgi:hypothetical protein